MTLINPQVIPPAAATPREFIFWWDFFRSFKVTLFSLAFIVIILIVSIIPQSPLINNGLLGLLLPNFDRELWVVSSPKYLLNSIWFWLPVGILTLNSLIALANLGLYTWQQRAGANIEWLHPWARRVEILTPPLNLDPLPHLLELHHLTLLPTTQPTLYQAVRYPWAWWGVTSFYAGCLTLCLALLGSHYLSQSNTLQLLPHNTQNSYVAQSEFRFIEVDGGGQTAQFAVKPLNASTPFTTTWSLYWPQWFNGSLASLTQLQPTLQISATNQAGAAVRLMPIQENLSPDEQIYLPITSEPLYFRIPTQNLNFQILPESLTLYQVQVQRQTEITPSLQLTASLDQPFSAESLQITFHLTYQAHIFIYHNYAFPLYLLTLWLWGFGLVSYIGFSPLRIWLIPEADTLYWVVEGFTSSNHLSEILQPIIHELSSSEPHPQ